MQSSKCLFSTATALHRVFIAPIEPSSRRCTSSIFSVQSAIRPTLKPATSLLLSQHRSVATAAPADKRESRLPRDAEITARSVILVNRDNSLSPPTNTSRVLASLDPSAQSLIQINPAVPGEPPLCKIVDKKKLYDQSKKAKNAKKSAVVSKSIELNWAIEEGDLGHRLKRLREFLEKGFKVEVAIAVKRKGRKATIEEAEALIGKVRGEVKDIQGAREGKKMEGVVGKDVTLHFEGTAPAAVKEEKVKKVKENGAVVEDEKTKKKDVATPLGALGRIG